MTEVFEPALLPDDEKRGLCEELLREFGVTRWRTTEKGEMIHSCPIPGGHRNGDRNPSASLNFRKLTFRCLGCGARGGLLWFIAVCRGGADAEDVRGWLAEATGTGGHVMDSERLLDVLEALLAPDAPPAPIPTFPVQMLDAWTRWPIQHPYLTDPAPDGRGCPSETLDRFRVGYAEDYFMGRDRPTQERIIIPVFWRGDLVGWQARKLAPWDEPKYKNSIDFPGERVIYGYHDLDTALVVESPLSVLRHHHHVPELLSTLGAGVSDAQVRLLHRYRKVILWFDNDPAGWTATEQVGDALLPFTDVWAVQSPFKADPADLDDATVEEMTSGAVPFVIWERPIELKEWRNAA